jgi:hypothetical protein
MQRVVVLTYQLFSQLEENDELACDLWDESAQFALPFVLGQFFHAEHRRSRESQLRDGLKELPHDHKLPHLLFPLDDGPRITLESLNYISDPLQCQVLEGNAGDERVGLGDA